MSVCVPHTCSAHEGQKRALDSLGLELQIVLLAVMCWELSPDSALNQSIASLVPVRNFLSWVN